MLVRNIFGFDWDLTSPLERSFDARLERLAVDRAALLAASLANQALSDDPSSHGIAWLHLQVVGTPHPWQFPAQARDWLTGAIASGRVATFRRVPPMGDMGQPDYAAMLAIERGTRSPQVAATAPDSHAVAADNGANVAIFPGTGASLGVADVCSDTCPSNNWRSESTTSCKPEVHQWFKDKGVNASRQEGTLGREGGGGFVATTTVVRRLPAGTHLYRYVNTTTKPYGGWWFLDPLEGDPRVFAALPPDSTAQYQVQAILRRDVDALYGPGAPRCSNKPGGPDQVCIAWIDYDPGQGDVLQLVS